MRFLFFLWFFKDSQVPKNLGFQTLGDGLVHPGAFRLVHTTKIDTCVHMYL